MAEKRVLQGDVTQADGLGTGQVTTEFLHLSVLLSPSFFLYSFSHFFLVSLFSFLLLFSPFPLSLYLCVPVLLFFVSIALLHFS